MRAARHAFPRAVIGLFLFGCGRDDTVRDSKEPADLYGRACASCHESGAAASRAPGRVVLAEMSPRILLETLTIGAMATQAAALSSDEKRQLVEQLTGRRIDAREHEAGECGAAVRRSMTLSPLRWSGWSGRVGAAIETTRSEPQLMWAFGFDGATSARSQPAVAGDLVVVGSHSGDVTGLDLRSGCRLWRFHASAALRGAVSLIRLADGSLAAAFADVSTWVYLVDATTGALAWRVRVGDHPYAAITGSIAIVDGRVLVPISSGETVVAADPRYPCCSFSGQLVALDLTSGREQWRFRAIEEQAVEVGRNSGGGPVLAPSGAPIWSSPTIDLERRLVYVGTGQSYTRPAAATSDAILAVSLETGKLNWKFQGASGDAFNLSCLNAFGRQVIRGDASNCPSPIGGDVDFGMAPIVVADGERTLLIAGQKSGVVYALDADDAGRVVWSSRVGRGGPNGGVHWGLATDGRRVFAPVSDSPTGVPGLEPTGPTRAGLYALDVHSGNVIWTYSPSNRCGQKAGCLVALSAAPLAFGNRVVVGGLDGWIDLVDAASGRVLWSYDTAREFETVNGIPARGGAIDGPSPALAGDVLLVSSGYALMDQMPGNVLLAFRLR